MSLKAKYLAYLFQSRHKESFYRLQAILSGSGVVWQGEGEKKAAKDRSSAAVRVSRRAESRALMLYLIFSEPTTFSKAGR
jgi:hypothetical protein